MKLQVTQENLNRALSSVSRVASSRGTLSILANVLLKTSNNRLSISATNLDIAITQYIGAKISEEGSITVPARLMQDFVSSLPEGIINIELDDSKLHVSTEQYNSVVNGIVADDFPTMPALTGGQEWKVDASKLKKALQQVVFAASSDETRPVLTGVLIKASDGDLAIAATDSYRLAEKELGKQSKEINLLIPASAMQDLLRVIGDYSGDIVVRHDDQQVLFTVGDIELVSRQLDGKYPDYKKLIPSKFEISAEMKKADLVNVTKVSSLFARESAGSVTIAIDEDKQELSIRSIASQLGENTATAKAKIKGSGNITLNSKFMLDALGAIDGDEVNFSLNGKLDPTLLTDIKAPEYKHIVMPLKS
jgi:DNA polymerase-3 subunit beta